MATRRGRDDAAAGAASKAEEQDRGGVSERAARQSGEWGVGAAPTGLLTGPSNRGIRHRQTPSNGCRDGRRCHVRKKGPHLS